MACADVFLKFLVLFILTMAKVILVTNTIMNTPKNKKPSDSLDKHIPPLQGFSLNKLFN